MGTKAKSKTRPTETEGSVKKAKKTKRIFLFRMVHKRKRLSQSQEFLHDPLTENFKTDIERDDQDKEREVDMDAATNVLEHPDRTLDDILSESASQDENDHAGDDGKLVDEKRKAYDEKKRLFGSPIKFLKNSFSTKKRRKQSEYSKFSESTDNFFSELNETEQKAEDESVVDGTSDNLKQTKKANSKRYVRFETDDDDDKENMAMTIDEVEDQLQSSSTPKKKKSAKKRVAKAGRKTGRVFREGMIQIGRNLQYLTPMPTPHVFADNTKKKADYTDKPKKRNYKYTASAPPSNPYGFV